MTDEKPTCVSEFLEAAWPHINSPDKWYKGGLHSTDQMRHCSLGALDLVRDRMMQTAATHEERTRIGQMRAEAESLLITPGGRFKTMPVPTRNDRSTLTWSGLKGWWTQTIETARTRDGRSTSQQMHDAAITARDVAAANIRRMFGFPRHLEKTVNAQESDLTISGD